MKKILIVLALSTLFVTVKAQVSFGPKAGLNLAFTSINNPEAVTNPLVASFNLGGFVDYKLADNIALKAELFYSGEGAQSKTMGNPIVYTDKINYLNLPVLFQLMSAKGLFIETGPQIGFLLSASSSESDISGSTDIKSDVNSTKFSWCFGIGKQPVNGLGFSIRYAADLSNLDKDASNGTVKTSVFSIGLLFAIHPKG